MRSTVATGVGSTKKGTQSQTNCNAHCFIVRRLELVTGNAITLLSISCSASLLLSSKATQLRSWDLSITLSLMRTDFYIYCTNNNYFFIIINIIIYVLNFFFFVLHLFIVLIVLLYLFIYCSLLIIYTDI